MDYLYDGSFNGFLTCVYYSYKKKKASGIYEKNTYQYSLINEYEDIKTNEKYSSVVYEAIENKISKHAMYTIYCSFLSYFKDKENKILKFIEFGFSTGKKVTNYHSHDKVLPVKEMYINVTREEHHFLGLLRFSLADGFLYAKYNPDNDITVLITPHFADRYKYEKFIIHDVKRKIASVYSNDVWEIVGAENLQELMTDDFSNEEKLIKKLWKEYFTTLSIKDRECNKIQQQKIPTRQRKHMVEFNG